MQETGDALNNKTLKRIAIFALKLFISSSLLYFVLKKAGIAKVGGLLKNIDPIYFIAAIGIFFLIMLICSIRWSLLLPEHFSLKRVFPLYLIGSFFNVFLPGLVGGDVVKVYYLYRETGRGAQALASVFMDRYLGYAGLMALGTVAYPFGYRLFKGTWITPVLPGIVLFFILTSLFIFMAKPGGRFAIVTRIHNYLHIYLKNRPVLAKAFSMSVVIHILSSVSVMLIARGLGEQIPLLTFFVFVPVIGTLAALPLSISGLGIREAAFVLLLGTQGVSPENATAISFGWFISIAIGGLPGLVFYLKEKSSSHAATPPPVNNQ
jgi:hypothetical protein